MCLDDGGTNIIWEQARRGTFWPSIAIMSVGHSFMLPELLEVLMADVCHLVVEDSITDVLQSDHTGAILSVVAGFQV